MKILNLVFIAILAVLLSGCGNEKHHMSLNEPNGFKSVFANGKLKFNGIDEPYILFFFTSECGACNEQVKNFNALKQEYPNLKIIGILGDSKGLDKDIENVKRKGINFPVITNFNSAKYFANIVGGIMGTPVSVIFDKDGNRLKSLLGVYPKSAFKAVLG